MIAIVRVDASHLLGAIAIASGLLMLWETRQRRPDRPIDHRAASEQSQKARSTRQVLLSLCGLLLVAIGSMLARETPKVQPNGCSLELSGERHDAPLPPCYHGAPRRAAP